MSAPRTEPAYRLVPISSLVASPHNPRKHFAADKLEKLAASFRKVGVIEPLIARVDPIEANLLEVVAGERRLRAARLAGLTEVPVIVRTLSDQEAREVQIFENLEREDVHFLEEGNGYNALLDMRDPQNKPLYTVQSIAARLDRSIEYVYGRMQAAFKLIPEAREAAWQNKITAGHAVAIARCEPKDQPKALAYSIPQYGNPPGVKDLERWIRDEMHTNLAQACFDTKSSTLLPDAGPCTTCPKRSGNAIDFQPAPAKPPKRDNTRGITDEDEAYQDALEAGSPDMCTDPRCFEAKQKAHLVLVEQQLRAKGDYVKVTNKYSYNKNELKGGVLPSNRWNPAAKGEASKPALITDGPDVGKVIQVRVKPPQKEAQQVDYAAQQKQREEKAKLESSIRLAILKEIGAKVQHLTTADIAALIVLQIDFSAAGRTLTVAELHGVNTMAALKARIPKMPAREFARLVMEVPIACRESSGWSESAEYLDAAAKRYKVDAAAIRKRLTQPPAAATPAKSKPKPAKKAAKAGAR